MARCTNTRGFVPNKVRLNFFSAIILVFGAAKDLCMEPFTDNRPQMFGRVISFEENGALFADCQPLESMSALEEAALQTLCQQRV